MTSDKTLDELKAWIEVNDAAVSWTVVKSGIATDKAHPLVVLECTGAEEHEILRGVYELSITARIETIPHEDGSTASATTLAEHEALATELYCILANTEAIAWIDQRGAVRCFDIRGSEGILEDEDGKRITPIELRVTACKSQL